jgi:TfoX/Sxy family transcriptional regulator of competence genes
VVYFNSCFINEKGMTKEVYEKLKKHFATIKDVTVLSGTGAQGMKFKGKMFAMFTKGQILLKLPSARVDELIASGEGLPYDAGTGKTMKNWVLIPETRKDSWVKYCEEAKNFLAK